MKRKRIPLTLRFQVLNEAGFRCHYCGRGAESVVLEVDHIEPVSLGGLTVRENLTVACRECNGGKSNRRLKAALAGRVVAVSNDLADCGDCCPWCDVGVVTRPVAMTRHGHELELLYRCQAGHEWTTWMPEPVARHIADCTRLEQIPCWPA